MTMPPLPELSRLLDAASLHARLATISDPRGMVVGVAPFYLRWKPGTSALVGVRLTWQTADGLVDTLASLYLGEGHTEAADKAATLRLLEPAMGPALARLDGALYLAFPNDRALKGLSAVADPRRIGNRLVAPGTTFTEQGLRVKARGSRVNAVRWKPERRAVLELDLQLVNDTTGARETWHAFARVMPERELESRLARWHAVARLAPVAAPRVLFVDSKRSWFATAAMPGRVLAGAPAPPLRAALHSAFAALHAAPDGTLGTRDDRDDFAAAARALEALANLAPDLAARTAELHARLASVLGTLPAAPCVLTHGDLGADQMLVDDDRVSVIDWDEAANGDPHADWASLAVDLHGRALDNAWVEPLAREVLADRFEPSRFAWQCAASEARRVIEALQRGRADWRPRALGALEAAERALAAGVSPAAAPGPVLKSGAPPASGVAAWLAALADPGQRFTVPGVDARAPRIAAVWPDGQAGAIVRLECADAPGVVVRWLRLGHAVERFDFPDDPALPALGGLLALGRFTAAGHRLGKRAALRETVGARFLFLRAAGSEEKAFMRVSEAYRRLSEAGVPASRPLGLAEGMPGWWAESVPGQALDPARADAKTWETLGATLARVHATPVGDEVPAGGLDAAVRAGRKQVALIRLADPIFAGELDRDMSELELGAPIGRPAWIHGDLHPLQVIVGPKLVILDWERAHVGEAEEDLGNFLAHLAWEAFDEAPAAWSMLLLGYAQAGGVWESSIVGLYARAALARVRAVHGWRDGSRERARDSARWHKWREGLAC